MNHWLSVLPLAFLFGLRHGLDWDHVIAISDIVGTNEKNGSSLILSTCYVAGHALVVLVLGLVAVVVGLQLPAWVDPLLYKVVGVTLIAMGAWFLLSLARHGKRFRPKSRFALLFSLFLRSRYFVKTRLMHQYEHHHIQKEIEYAPAIALSVGIIHGIGAQTPTQLVLFAMAVGSKGSYSGTLLIISFVAGLVASHAAITAGVIAGAARLHKNAPLFLIIAAITGIISIGVGILFVLGFSGGLPTIFG